MSPSCLRLDYAVVDQHVPDLQRKLLLILTAYGESPIKRLSDSCTSPYKAGCALLGYSSRNSVRRMYGVGAGLEGIATAAVRFVSQLYATPLLVGGMVRGWRCGAAQLSASISLLSYRVCL
jgi:hypothetical protein